MTNNLAENIELSEDGTDLMDYVAQNFLGYEVHTEIKILDGRSVNLFYYMVRGVDKVYTVDMWQAEQDPIWNPYGNRAHANVIMDAAVALHIHKRNGIYDVAIHHPKTGDPGRAKSKRFTTALIIAAGRAA